MSIRLALVRQRYNPFGGAERFVSSALDALKEHDLSLTLITREWEHGNSPHQVMTCNPKYLSRLGRDQSFAQGVQQMIAREKFDLVQSHERIAGCDLFRAGDGVHAAWLEQRARHQGWFGRLSDHLSPWHRYTLAAEKEMFHSPKLKAVICISEMVRQDIIRHYHVDEKKLHVIYNGIDLERFSPQLTNAHRERVRAEYNIDETTPLFIYVGSGFERKGVDSLLEALAQARSPAHLLIVGKDKQLKKYQAKAKALGLEKRVSFTGGVKDVTPLLGAADAFIMPTRYEPLSNAVLEALASGLPTIISHQCGAAELIQDGVNGFVCDSLDVPALAQHIETLSAPGIAASMRAAARASVMHLGLANMSQKLIALYTEILSRREAGKL